ncbi:SAVED domain-containing protein [Thalassospira tepidiphila]|uniref:SAVED domain-containing protein n=1 Tax=Thalassospira tepidiphila TaxID=393657 RepID=UPI0029211B6A|nr:hypothetical protein MACH01_37610 [Thalassospira tepidiphila]
MEKIIEHFGSELIGWIFRRRSPWLTVVRAGSLVVLAALAGGVVFDVSLPLADGELSLNFSNVGGTPTILVYSAFVIGFAIMIFGIWMEVRRQQDANKVKQRNKAVFIELRGLRQSPGVAIEDGEFVDSEWRKQRINCDLRQNVHDGMIIAPEIALEKLLSLPTMLKSSFDGENRADIKVFFGGLAPVPLTFLAGVLLDDEGPVTIVDWDRHKNQWRNLNGLDDGTRPESSGLGQLPQNVTNVALCVSISYAVDVAAVREVLPGVPVVECALSNKSTDNHWSAEKQIEIGQKFLETVQSLAEKGVEQIQLFLAAQSSVVFRLGRLYDHRNLPKIVVYQYERGQPNCYPWGIAMPVAGLDRPHIVSTEIAVQE